MIRLKSEADIEKLKISGKILATVLTRLQNMVEPGVTLNELNFLAKKLIKEFGAKPSFLGYRQSKNSPAFPAAICASVNENLVHGIPDDYALKSGDLLKIDLGIDYGSYITDGAVSVGVGAISPLAEKLIKATKLSLEEGIKTCKLGNRTGDIGWIIEKTVKNLGFSVAEKLTGHGVGFEVHEDPSIYNYGEKGTGQPLEEGLVIAIEPMVITGSAEVVENSDGSFSSRDKSLTAHFEKTVAITKNGPIILTPIEVN